jgi:hypothetical protein
MVLHTGTAKTMFGKLWSEEYFAVPLVLTGPSMRGTELPMMDAGVVAISCAMSCSLTR